MCVYIPRPVCLNASLDSGYLRVLLLFLPNPSWARICVRHLPLTDRLAMHCCYDCPGPVLAFYIVCPRRKWILNSEMGTCARGNGVVSIAIRVCCGHWNTTKSHWSHLNSIILSNIHSTQFLSRI